LNGIIVPGIGVDDARHPMTIFPYMARVLVDGRNEAVVKED